MTAIELRLWSDEDLPLVRRYLADAEMTKFLGGPQSEEEIASAHQRYLDSAVAGTGWMFKVVADGEIVGSVGYWDKAWRDDVVYEVGWSVFPEFQRRGHAAVATEMAIGRARDGDRRFMHAFPNVDNDASNAICTKLDFELLEELQFEYPKASGNIMRCYDWRLDLHAV